jgi:hypothetical protein
VTDVGRSATSPTSPTNLEKVKAGGAVAFEGLKTTLRVLKESSDAFPPLKAAVGGLLACMDTVEVRDQVNLIHFDAVPDFCRTHSWPVKIKRTLPS